jgi:catechol 2,3-dioxygenase-like lactoylglutathione lyase family enzyme
LTSLIVHTSAYKYGMINAIAADIDKTIDFYTDIMGFKVTKRTKVQKPYPKDTVSLSLNNTITELEFFKDGYSTPMTPLRVGYHQLIVEVDNLDDTIKYLTGKGIELYWNPETFGKYRRAEIKDPNGLPIVLCDVNVVR